MFIIFDSWEWIEREYVLVPINNTSMEMTSVENSTKDDTCTRNAGYDRTDGKGSIQNQNRYFIQPRSQPMQKIEERGQLTILQGFIC
jgi:hypothetical protein